MRTRSVHKFKTCVIFNMKSRNKLTKYVTLYHYSTTFKVLTQCNTCVGTKLSSFHGLSWYHIYLYIISNTMIMPMKL